MDVKTYYGPGYWAAMHIDSFNARTYEKKITVANTIARLITKFPCEKCRRHATEYSTHHPLIHAINDGDELSLFKWVWKFHNNVNQRIGKQIINFEDALKKWGEQSICLETNCDADDE